MTTIRSFFGSPLSSRACIRKRKEKKRLHLLTSIQEAKYHAGLPRKPASCASCAAGRSLQQSIQHACSAAMKAALMSSVHAQETSHRQGKQCNCISLTAHRQTDRQTGMRTDSQTGMWSDRHAHRQTYRQEDRHKQAGRQAGRQAGIVTNRRAWWR